MRLRAQTSGSGTADEPNKSWTATTDREDNNLRPTRIVESHSQSENGSIDQQSLQVRGFGGDFEPYQEIQKDTQKVDATSVRTTTRTFALDSTGMKTLVQVTEEERHTLPGGNSNVLRITSNPDLNGRLQPVQREVIETKRISVDTEETNTTVMIATIAGGLAPVLKTDEIRKRGANDMVESRKTTLLADGAGNWQVNEVQESTIKQEENTRSTEERVFRRDYEGKLSEFSRVVSLDSENTAGERGKVVETYSVDVPWTTRDGSLHLVESATTTQRTTTGGRQITEEQVEQTNPGDPDSGVRLTILSSEAVQPDLSGVRGSRTIRASDGSGNLSVVSIDTTKSDRVPVIEVQQMQ